MEALSKCKSIALVIGLFLLSSCGGTKLSNGWLNSTYEGRYVKSVLVVATSDQFDKRKLEGTFAKHFQEHDVTATSLASIAKKKELTSADVRAEATGLSMDAIFTVRIVSIGEKEFVDRFAPPPEASPEWSYSWPIYTIQRPPAEYRFEEKDIVMELNLYDTSTGRLMWRVRSETIKPGSTANLIDEVARTAMKDLKAGRLLR
jgi:hypothetical protein